MTRRATIRQVAEAANASVATVSRLFAGSTRVSPGLAERIRAAADELGYRPNLVARGLARGSTGVVGALVPDLDNPYFSAIAKALMHSADRDGYQVIIGDSDERPEEEPRRAESLRHWADGLVFVAPRGRPAQLRQLVPPDKPVVWLDAEPRVDGAVTITIDSYAAVRAMCQRLVKDGHRRLTYLHGPRQSWQDQQRWRAVRSLQRSGVTVADVPCGGVIADGHAAAEAALATRPTAVVAFNDLAALGFMIRCGELGVDVPGDVSLTGFDDIPFTQFARPQLTTVRTPLAEMGTAAWSAMRALLGGETHVAGTSLTPQVVFRASTGPPKRRHRARTPAR